MDTCIIDLCIIAVEVENEVLVNFARVTKGREGQSQEAGGPPPRSQGPEGP